MLEKFQFKKKMSIELWKNIANHSMKDEANLNLCSSIYLFLHGTQINELFQISILMNTVVNW